MPSQIKKKEQADERTQKQEQRKAIVAHLAEIPKHNALTVTVDGSQIVLKIDVNFKKDSSISLIGKDDGPKKDQGSSDYKTNIIAKVVLDANHLFAVLTHVLHVIGQYKEIATIVRVGIFYGDPEDESPVLKHNQTKFLRSLATLLNSFTRANTIKIGVKMLKEIHWPQARNSVCFCCLSLKGWELYLGYDVPGQETTWKQVIEGSPLDRRYLGWQKVLRQRYEARLNNDEAVEAAAVNDTLPQAKTPTGKKASEVSTKQV
ncbi:hypothetical protein GLAREA_08564 [Glarea lozoyensis ATCC 20868]|uniref:Uncharacterized protein n=1 Tax=Glarea lozoyensis (strain ATCC 20868 / MF5171) TaxID=1116229 RepID=S3CY06_GLAL2|nr:uncharacterized protein GLAREA_08564 [Glarea lozoyensis ATCC 20868]EPE24711.1 hypothetical protein GLAREA_08564 [Glarea lozoyensis ATCC 20868]